MLTITDEGSLSRALSSSIDTRLKELLIERVRQLAVDDLTTAACFVIVRPGDTDESLEQALGFSVFRNPADGTRFGDPDFSPGWEWLASHPFGYELTFEGTTDFTTVVMVEVGPGTDPDLLKLFATYAGEQAVG